MSVTNAISGLTAVASMLLMGGGLLPTDTAQTLAATALVAVRPSCTLRYALSGHASL